METQGERLNQIISYLGISQRQFSKQIAVSQAFISKMVKNTHQISSNFINKLIYLESLNDNNKRLNIDWLLSGEGEMFVNKLSLEFSKMGDVMPEANVIVVPFPVNAGNGITSQLVEVVTKAYLPMVKTGSFVFPVKGESMRPVFEDNDWIICTEIRNVEEIKIGKIYVIKTREGAYLCKYIDKRGVKWILRSENYNNHAPIEMLIEDIAAVYEVKQRLTNHFGWE